MEAIARVEAIATRVEAIATRVEAIATKVEAIGTKVEAIATRLEAIATRLEAIATRLEAIATRLEAIATRLEAITTKRPSLLGWRPSPLGWRPSLVTPRLVEHQRWPVAAPHFISPQAQQAIWTGCQGVAPGAGGCGRRRRAKAWRRRCFPGRRRGPKRRGLKLADAEACGKVAMIASRSNSCVV